MEATMLSFYEFFAGGGMARAGLGKNWTCLFANNFDHKKGKIYKENWGRREDDKLKIEDVCAIKTSDLPGQPDLVWGSFPCQDLSLAGGGAGLKGDRSGTFWPFWDKMKSLKAEGRAPSIIVLENVCGTLTSHRGKDFKAICDALAQSGYQFGAVIIDASLFLPQSRHRLFVIGVRDDVEVPAELKSQDPHPKWHSQALKVAHSRLTPMASKN
jgi:DNA (cytosine-5)-methyltransferase 1